MSKAVLDGAAHPTGERWQVPNTPDGIGELVSRLHELAPERIVLEATGGLEVPSVAALGSVGLPVAAANRCQARDCARATGRLAKTDALDAWVLAHFAAVVRPAVRPLPDAAARRLGALVATSFDYGIVFDAQVPLVAEAGFTPLSLGAREEHSGYLSVEGRQWITARSCRLRRCTSPTSPSVGCLAEANASFRSVNF